MDYNPVNLAPKGVKQGDYFSSTIGPYDYWAIEYAYKPLMGGTEGELTELHKIAARCASPGLDYATDEDMYGSADPYVNVWDIGSDPMKFAQDRMLLAEEIMKDLADKVVDKGEGYQRTRQAFDLLLGQYGNSAYLVSAFVGGEKMYRDHRGDANARDPFVPVTGVKQREALKFLQDHILTDKPFQFPPDLLRKLAADRWSHWGNDDLFFRGVEYPLYDRILAIQRVVLRNVLNPSVLARIQNNALKAEKGEQPLTVAEAFRSVTDGIWNPPTVVASAAAATPKPANGASLIRRNLQREHIKDLSGLLLGKSTRGFDFIMISSRPAPADARSLARMHLREIQKKLEACLKEPCDDTTRAHYEECQERIAKVLTATMTLSD